MDEVGMGESGQWPEAQDADAFLYESDVREWDAEVAGWVPPRPDAVALVLEAADLEAVFAAQRFARVDDLRLEALDDVTRYGG
ncbi:MAG: hypothetical protein IE935_15215, partial [Micrococcales bacterium]|nr:hypothetical protein [Micrococcales bacterium]